MISDAAFDLMREVWAAQIPDYYRWTGRFYSERGDPTRGAIVAPPPPPAIVERWLRSIFGEQHLTVKQQAAKDARLRIGRPGRKRTRLSRARPKPHLMSFSELAAETKPYLDLDLTHG